MTQLHFSPYELKNKYTHIDYEKTQETDFQSAKDKNSKCKNCTLDEMAIEYM